MKSIDTTSIPLILQNADLDVERNWPLQKVSELLQIAYQLREHPVLKNWRGHEAISIFDDPVSDPEGYKRLNSTVVERTITQANYFSHMKVGDREVTMVSKGIEFSIRIVESFYLNANKLFNSTDKELRDMGAGIHFFRLTRAGELTSCIRYFLGICNSLIELTFKDFIQNRLNKLTTDMEKRKYLLRQKTDLLQKQDQFDEKVMAGVISFIDIELGYLHEVQVQDDISAEVQAIIRQFMAEKKARISNNQLLGFLLEGKIGEFCQALSALVLELFSYNDVGKGEPEKVYHAFLLGVCNSFKEFYQVESNREAGLGRFDIALIPESLEYTGMIIEVKRSPVDDQESMEQLAQEALAQIRDNQYSVALKSKGHSRYIALAAVFYGKELHLWYQINTIS